MIVQVQYLLNASYLHFLLVKNLGHTCKHCVTKFQKALHFIKLTFGSEVTESSLDELQRKKRFIIVNFCNITDILFSDSIDTLSYTQIGSILKAISNYMEG